MALSESERSRVFAAALLVVVFVTGILAGIVFDRCAFGHQRPFRHGPPWSWGGGRPHDGPERGHPWRGGRAAERLMRELELSDEQRAAVDSLMERQLERSREIQRTVRPRIDSITEETHSELMEILTPEQRERFEQLHERRRSRRGGPSHDRP